MIDIETITQLPKTIIDKIKNVLDKDEYIHLIDEDLPFKNKIPKKTFKLPKWIGGILGIIGIEEVNKKTIFKFVKFIKKKLISISSESGDQSDQNEKKEDERLIKSILKELEKIEKDKKNREILVIFTLTNKKEFDIITQNKNNEKPVINNLKKFIKIFTKKSY